MKKTPILHFDVFGTLPHVIDMVDKHVPKIFKDEDVTFIASLKTIIRQHAMTNHWDTIVLSLSKGMARAELDIILNHPIDHVGPIVIDPTAHTPEHDVFYKDGLLAARRERIIEMNNQTGDVMIVLFGIHGLGQPQQLKMLMRRFHYMGVTLDLLIERDDEIDAGPLEKQVIKRMQRVLDHVSHIYESASFDSSDGIHAPAIVPQMAETAFMALASLLTAYHMTHDPNIRASLEGLSHQIVNMPAFFKELEFSFDPYEKAVLELRNTQPVSEPAPVVPPPTITPVLKPTDPHQHNHDHKHDHHAYDTLIPKLEPR